MLPFGISGVVAYCDDFFLFILRFCWSGQNMFYVDLSLTLYLVWLEWLSFGGSLVFLSFLIFFFFSFLLFSGTRFTNIYPGFILPSFVPAKVPSLSSPDCYTSWNLAWNFLHLGTANKELYSFLTIFPCLLFSASFKELDFSISFLRVEDWLGLALFLQQGSFLHGIYCFGVTLSHHISFSLVM